MGYKRHAGQPDDGSHDTPRDVLFGTGSALVRADRGVPRARRVRRAVLHVLRGRRPRLAAEPARLARPLRADVAGLPQAPRLDVELSDHSRELYLLERNALAALYKNFSDETLAKVLPAALALVVRRATARGEIDATQLEITRRPADPANDRAPVPVSRQALAGFLAIDQFVELLPSLAESRKAEQAARRVTDTDLVPLMRKAMEPAYPLPRYLAAHDVLVEVFGLDEVFGRPRRILVITGDASPSGWPAPRSGPGTWPTCCPASTTSGWSRSTRCATPPEASFPVERAPCRATWSRTPSGPTSSCSRATCWRSCGSLKEPASTKIVVCDIYDPMHLELLEQGKDSTDEQRALDLVGVTRVLNNQLRRGDFFLCASERQRHFWLGHLAALGRLTPALYDNDPTVRSLLAEAPFGLPGKPPQRTGPAVWASTLGHRRVGQGRAVGGRRLQLVRPADAAARDGPAADPPAGRAAVVPRHEAPQPRRARHGHRRADPRAGQAAGPRRTRTCSSTRPGCPTTTGRTGCSTRTPA